MKQSKASQNRQQQHWEMTARRVRRAERKKRKKMLESETNSCNIIKHVDEYESNEEEKAKTRATHSYL